MKVLLQHNYHRSVNFARLGISLEGEKLPHAEFKLVKQIRRVDQQKAVWFENDCCIASYIATLFTIDYFFSIEI